MTLEKGLATFLDGMLGKNRSAATLRAYKTDVLQFITFLRENNVTITDVADGSCPSSVRVNTRDLPGDRRRGKKA
jgi:site-specific recombinase XerD